MKFSVNTWKIIKKTALVLVFVSAALPALFKGSSFCYGKYVNYQLEKYCKQLTIKDIKKSLSTEELSSLESSEFEVNLLNDEKRNAFLHRCADSEKCISFVRLFRGDFPGMCDLKKGVLIYYSSAYTLGMSAIKLRSVGEKFSRDMEEIKNAFNRI